MLDWTEVNSDLFIVVDEGVDCIVVPGTVVGNNRVVSLVVMALFEVDDVDNPLCVALKEEQWYNI